MRIVTYPSGSLLDMLRPRASSQPAAASLPDALGALLGRTVGGILDNVERSYSGASALWLGPWRLSAPMVATRCARLRRACDRH